MKFGTSMGICNFLLFYWMRFSRQVLFSAVENVIVSIKKSQQGSAQMERINARTAAKISVIVPVYKVEPYLRACIDSILNQTFRDFELILIDDGSPDDCGAICDEYAQKDNRIVVLHQENGGLSSARNTGLDWVFANSNSEWVSFVDSDDLLAPTTLNHLIQYAEQYAADIVSTKATVFTDEAQLESSPHHVVYAEELTGPEAARSIYCRDGCVPVTAWGKLFKRDTFISCRFPVGKIHEDDALIPQILHAANTVVALQAWLYLNRVREGSITNSSFSLKRFDRVEGIDGCIAFFESRNDPETAKLAKQFRDEVCATTVLRAWKNKMIARVPKAYRMSLLKAVYLTVKDSVRRGGFRFIIDRIKTYFQ